MPTYQYRCTRCNHSFEHFQSMTSPLLLICPNCNNETLERIIGGGAGLMFKGNGFYITDYKKTNSNSGSSAKPVDPKKSETKSNDSIPKKK